MQLGHRIPKLRPECLALQLLSRQVLPAQTVERVCRSGSSIRYEPMPTFTTDGHGHSTGLVEVLDRVLDKGLVVAGDIKISLAEVELLTIRIRLLICSIDKAEQIGLDW